VLLVVDLGAMREITVSRRHIEAQERGVPNRLGDAHLTLMCVVENNMTLTCDYDAHNVE
jgi:hypothetical protein